LVLYDAFGTAHGGAILILSGAVFVAGRDQM
jgi:hypothetical protein